MAERRYRPAHGPAHILLKDLKYIEAECRRLGVEAPLLQPALEWFGKLVDSGRGLDEGASIFQLLEAAYRTAR